MSEQPSGDEYEIINGIKVPLKDKPKKVLPKRFYKSVFVEQAEQDGQAGQGFCVKLDQRILTSPERVRLVWPSRDLAQRVAQEWDFQEQHIKLFDMPMTTLSYSAIGRTEKIYDEHRTEMLSYAGSDLIVYRAMRPKALIEQQKRDWNPVLSWLEQTYGARFESVEGVSFVDQPKQSLSKIEDYLAALPCEHLAAMMSMTKLSGSLFLAMSVKEEFLDSITAWQRATIDEEWQNSQWGEDEVQKQKLLIMKRDFAAAADFLKLYMT